jgi:hypothetical protein
MAPLRDKLFVIGLIVLTALAIAAVPRIHAAAPDTAGSSGDDAGKSARARSDSAITASVKSIAIKSTGVKTVNGAVRLAELQRDEAAPTQAQPHARGAE